MIFPLYFVGMVLLTAIMGVIWGFTALFMASYSLVFLLGGAASILYGFGPAIGIALIVAGVGLEYESRRSRERQNREQVGRLLRIIEHRDGD